MNHDRGHRDYVYARRPTRSGRPGPWLLGLVADVPPRLPGGPLEEAGDPGEQARRAVRRLTGRDPRLLAPPVPPFEDAGPHSAHWWVTRPPAGPWAVAHEFVMTLPEPSVRGLTWVEPASALGWTRPEDEALELAAALGEVLDSLTEGRITPEVVRALTVGHSRSSLRPARTVTQW
ncbi:hypothetical protein [Streptomyces chilikensis]|uniref:NUDIX hydrolase n=1 Tax=Streptomyces chilikensis TaxID=1194079 RepID=A0ABV3EVQ4_9ACTN|nr:hypothetical protein [Streptomyces chilikensis]